MRWCAGIISLLTVVVLLLPELVPATRRMATRRTAPAQAPEKKDAKTDGDKKEAKKEEDKKDEKKDDEKSKKKEVAKKGPEVVYGQVVKAKLTRMDANSARDFSIEVSQVDPQKVNDLETWQVKEMIRISGIQKPQDRVRDMAAFQTQLAVKQNNDIYTLKEVKLCAAENCKVRSLMPPVEFDDKGRLKTLTKKDLAALKGTSKLPGYPAEFDRLAAGQMVAVYFAKTKATSKKEAAAALKKKFPEDEGAGIPEVVMIVVEQDPPMAEVVARSQPGPRNICHVSISRRARLTGLGRIIFSR